MLSPNLTLPDPRSHPSHHSPLSVGRELEGPSLGRHTLPLGCGLRSSQAPPFTPALTYALDSLSLGLARPSSHEASVLEPGLPGFKLHILYLAAG